MKKTIPAIILLLACAATSASDWELVGVNGQSQVWVDASSIAMSGRFKKAWFRFDYVKSQDGTAHTSFKKYLESKQLEYFSCDERMSATVQVLYYGDDKVRTYLGGDSISPVSARYEEVAPDTFGEAMFNRVCVQGK